MGAAGSWTSRAIGVSFVIVAWGAASTRGDEADASGLASLVRVQLKGEAGAAVRRAVTGARLRLAEPSCDELLSEFTDASGRPLRAHLEELGLSAAEYMGAVLFVDGASQKACSSGDALAGTRPGSRVVALCSEAFVETERKNPRLAQALVIHETLHSLGLGENPPSSREITARVLRSCQQRPRAQASPPAP